ncbi:unnamed protein product [Acanthoscelides obtectus]|uniref:Secreted protein n=1 Tax=Acanthoscelides obtectus TaxID=200917 RepID=A0A9P0LNG2_ACAOB|nr:unnamed protein product [Acanthoscelides obtectus]CAK1650171.1 hypothetical protein AOBTE_LOCUS16657 [Acanthoscelides obtectus]
MCWGCTVFLMTVLALQQHSSTPPEVTYAELSIVRPSSLDTSKGANHYAAGTNTAYRDDSTVYAQIDHSRRVPPLGGGPVKPSPIISPASMIFPAPVRPGYYHREVVTVRTPLMGAQESCV